MGKKKKHKQKHGDHHGHRHSGHDAGAGDAPPPQGGLPPQIAGIAAAVTRQLSSPEGRHMLAAGLTMAAAAASAALTRPVAQPRPPRPPEPPVPPSPAAAPPPPPEPDGPTGTTRAPDPQVIATVLNDVADQVLTRLFGSRKT